LPVSTQTRSIRVSEMTLATSLILFKLILTGGLGLWLAVVVLNNTTAFRNGVFSVGSMMAMQLFDQEPAIKTPLLSRRVTAAEWHRFIYGFVLLVEVFVAILLCHAALGFAGVIVGMVDGADALLRANLALSGLLAMTFIMLLGGAWFVYYIRQEGAQITHFVLIGVAIMALLAVNLPVS